MVARGNRTPPQYISQVTPAIPSMLQHTTIDGESHISLVKKAQVAQLKEVAQSSRVAETLADSVGAFLRAVEVGDKLFQEITPDFHLIITKRARAS